MPDPAKLLGTLRRATTLFRQTPGRRGRVVSLTGDDLLVAGDLHGNLPNLQAILTRADLKARPGRHLVLQEVIHSPYRYGNGGGDRSHQLLDLVAALKVQYPQRFHFLIGNHELAQRTGTVVSKGDTDYNAVFDQGVRTAYGAHADDVIAAYNDLIDAAPVALRTPGRVLLTHSLPSAVKLERFRFADLERDSEPADYEPGGAVHATVWGRDVGPKHVRAFLDAADADLLVTGHVPCDAGYHVPNPYQVILDSQGTPAATATVPFRAGLTHDELVAGVELLPG